jgi:MFS family permease
MRAHLFSPPPLLCFLARSVAKEEKQGEFDLRRISHFPLSYWLVVGLCVAFYSCVLPFTSFGVAFFNEKWGLGPAVSGRIVSIISFSSMIFSPLAGFLIDRIGRRTLIMIIGASVVIPAYLLLALTPVYPAVAVFVIGAAFSLVPSALWPCIPLVGRGGDDAVSMCRGASLLKLSSSSFFCVHTPLFSR